MQPQSSPFNNDIYTSLLEKIHFSKDPAATYKAFYNSLNEEEWAQTILYLCFLQLYSWGKAGLYFPEEYELRGSPLLYTDPYKEKEKEEQPFGTINFIQNNLNLTAKTKLRHAFNLLLGQALELNNDTLVTSLLWHDWHHFKEGTLSSPEKLIPIIENKRHYQKSGYLALKILVNLQDQWPGKVDTREMERLLCEKSWEGRKDVSPNFPLFSLKIRYYQKSGQWARLLAMLIAGPWPPEKDRAENLRYSKLIVEAVDKSRRGLFQNPEAYSSFEYIERKWPCLSKDTQLRLSLLLKTVCKEGNQAALPYVVVPKKNLGDIKSLYE